jgi:hypothetical protein
MAYLVTDDCGGNHCPTGVLAYTGGTYRWIFVASDFQFLRPATNGMFDIVRDLRLFTDPTRPGVEWVNDAIGGGFPVYKWDGSGYAYSGQMMYGKEMLLRIVK